MDQDHLKEEKSETSESLEQSKYPEGFAMKGEYLLPDGVKGDHNYELLWNGHTSALWDLIRFSIVIEIATLAAAWKLWDESFGGFAIGALVLACAFLGIIFLLTLRTTAFLRYLKECPGFLFSSEVLKRAPFKGSNLVRGEWVCPGLVVSLVILNIGAAVVIDCYDAKEFSKKENAFPVGKIEKVRVQETEKQKSSLKGEL